MKCIILIWAAQRVCFWGEGASKETLVTGKRPWAGSLWWVCLPAGGGKGWWKTFLFTWLRSVLQGMHKIRLGLLFFWKKLHASRRTYSGGVRKNSISLEQEAFKMVIKPWLTAIGMSCELWGCSAAELSSFDTGELSFDWKIRTGFATTSNLLLFLKNSAGRGSYVISDGFKDRKRSRVKFYYIWIIL